jgi:hypothetical protein
MTVGTAPIAGGSQYSTILRRIADLETVIAQQRSASSHLSAQGLPTHEVERIIDILISSLQLVRNSQAALGDGGPSDTVRETVKTDSQH